MGWVVVVVGDVFSFGISWLRRNQTFEGTLTFSCFGFFFILLQDRGTVTLAHKRVYKKARITLFTAAYFVPAE